MRGDRGFPGAETHPALAVRPHYNERLPGVYGEFGSGSGLQAFYVLTAVSPAQLRKISLVKDIPGSERWPVRELFQREVDDERVTRGLVPYLGDRERIKFFNSLILTVLPMEQSGGSVLAEMPRVVERVEEEGGQRWVSLEREGYFRVRLMESRPEYAELEWNNESSRLVAIDGQHRLSALKRLQAQAGRKAAGLREGRQGTEASNGGAAVGGRSFPDWRIPCVVVSFRVAGVRREPPKILEVVRNIFVDINTKAQVVGEARKVLLNDESVNAVAAQALLERAHSTDVKPRGERRRGAVPLLLFDWRGLEKGGEAQPTPAAVKSIVEIRDWFEHYVLGEDFSEYQAHHLGILGDPRFEDAWRRHRLDYRTSRLVREKVSDAAAVPALQYLLENFEPYRRYIEGLRLLEDQYTAGSDLQGHAFDRLRFGSSGEETTNKFQVDDVEQSLLVEIERVRKECLVPAVPIDQDIGMRGVVWAFSELAYEFGCDGDDWMEYAEWFTSGLNLAYEAGWFDPAYGQSGHDHLRHVIVDPGGTVVNYRLNQAKKAFGPYVALVVCSFEEVPEHWSADWQSVRVSLLTALEKTLISGYRKQEKPRLLPTYPDMGKPLTAAVKAAAEKLAGRHTRRFEQALRRIAEGGG